MNIENTLKSEGEGDEKNLVRIVHENNGCEEIKLQLENNKIKRFIAKEKISATENPNIERVCRQYSNQDILIKIRNGKKIIIERTRIINL